MTDLTIDVVKSIDLSINTSEYTILTSGKTGFTHCKPEPVPNCTNPTLQLQEALSMPEEEFAAHGIHVMAARTSEYVPDAHDVHSKSMSIDCVCTHASIMQ